MSKLIYAPISVGELFDKISILEIKRLKTTDEQKLKNITNELFELNRKLPQVVDKKLHGLYEVLKEINEKIWDIEDRIRIKEKEKDFNQEFIDLARGVYYNNDLRAKIKKDINLYTESEIVEEKIY
jgi:septal ring factor EnvC (AmiA/AmiB activator)